MKKSFWIVICILVFIVGFFVGKNSGVGAYKVEESVNDLYSTSSHKRECVKMYKEGVEVAENLKDSNMKDRFLYNDEFMTSAGYLKLEDVWIKDCIYKKERLDIADDMIKKGMIDWEYY